MTKSFIRLFILAAAAFGIASIPTSVAAQNVRTLIKKMEDHRISMKSLRSGITMVKLNNQLNESDVKIGKLQYLAIRDRQGKDLDALIRLDWVKPKPEIISIIKKVFTAYDPKNLQALRGSSDSKKVSEKGGEMVTLLANPSKEEISSKFVPQLNGVEKFPNGTRTDRIKLTPKTKTTYQFIELWVDEDGMPLQGMITALNGDTQTIRFDQVEENARISTESFEIKMDKGTKIIPV